MWKHTTDAVPAVQPLAARPRPAIPRAAAGPHASTSARTAPDAPAPAPSFGPPPWWPALRSHIERADRTIFDLYPDAYEFDRAPLPGELWPGQATTGAVVRVRLAGDRLERRLVLREIVGVRR